MCFSAPASFIASAGLALAGQQCLKISKTRGEKFTSLIPFLFSIQQLLEGFIWLRIGDYNFESYPNQWLVVAWLIFALLLWPIYIPLAMSQLESIKWRKNMHYALLFLGVTVAASLSYWAFTKGVYVRQSCESIQYNYQVLWAKPQQYVYFVCIFLPFLISSYKNIPIIGVLTIIAFIVAEAVYTKVFTSVWCFYMALISSLFYIALRGQRHKESRQKS